jgi:hypothetical protein
MWGEVYLIDRFVVSQGSFDQLRQLVAAHDIVGQFESRLCWKLAAKGYRVLGDDATADSEPAWDHEDVRPGIEVFHLWLIGAPFNTLVLGPRDVQQACPQDPAFAASLGFARSIWSKFAGYPQLQNIIKAETQEYVERQNLPWTVAGAPEDVGFVYLVGVSKQDQQIAFNHYWPRFDWTVKQAYKAKSLPEPSQAHLFRQQTGRLQRFSEIWATSASAAELLDIRRETSSYDSYAPTVVSEEAVRYEPFTYSEVALAGLAPPPSAHR